MKAQEYYLKFIEREDAELLFVEIKSISFVAHKLENESVF